MVASLKKCSEKTMDEDFEMFCKQFLVSMGWGAGNWGKGAQGVPTSGVGLSYVVLSSDPV